MDLWIWLTKRGRAVWTLGGNKVVSEEGEFQTQVADKRKSPVVRKKKKKIWPDWQCGRNWKQQIFLKGIRIG